MKAFRVALVKVFGLAACTYVLVLMAKLFHGLRYVYFMQVGHLTSNPSHDKPLKRRRTLDPATVDGWAAFADALETAEKTTTAAQSGFAFAFVEGALVRALRDGHWLLLDEMNLAPPEVTTWNCEFLLLILKVGSKNGTA